MSEASIAVQKADQSKKNQPKTLLEKTAKPKNFILDKINEIIFYAVILFTPILFLPETLLPLHLNKQFFILSVLFASLFVWLAGFVNSGKIKMRLNFPVAALFLLFFTSVVSWALSGRTHFGLFGFYGGEVSSVFNLAILFLLFFISQTVLTDRKKILNALVLFVSSSFLSLAFWFLGGNGFLSGFVSADSGFNTIGTENSLALFLIPAFIISIGLFLSLVELWEKLALSGLLAVLAAALFMLGFGASWNMLIVGVFLLTILYFSNRGNFENKKVQLSLLLVVLAASVFFSFSSVAKNPSDMKLSYGASKDIILKSYKEDYKNTIIGSGPASFHYSFLKHKEEVIPDVKLNRLEFNSGYSALTDYFADLGILGGLFFIAFFLSVLYSGARLLHIEANQGKYDAMAISLFVASLVSFAELVFSSSNYVILFLSVALGSALLSYRYSFVGKEVLNIEFSSSTKKIFLGFALSVLLIAVAIFAYYKFALRYMAELNYYKAMHINSLDGREDFFKLMDKAIAFDGGNDAYFRSAADFKLVILENDLKDLDPKKEENVKRVGSEIKEVEYFYSRAISLNPDDSGNFARLGSLYEMVSKFDGSAGQLAEDAYKKALASNPKSVDISFLLGKMYYENGKYSEAKDVFSGILASFPNDPDVRMYLGLSYFKLDDTENALKELEFAKSLDPRNGLLENIISDIKKPINNK